MEDKSAPIGGKIKKMEDIYQIGGHWRTMEDMEDTVATLTLQFMIV